ncbi:uncharacterized protein EDB93DRAFT_1120904 [Suillus bovinus]|uniref:uncharacterized protein n=1 Tax=Suillus bovinus TaxID=48563 RepID=UPI001B87C3D3|nr:uncharacterized protein EDB93DRAFT_1120904 [Suillus bovinus]KAG2158329.1 hypothetical protein EDB93DRAFT_1120904 [Suillus bovinus]
MGWQHIWTAMLWLMAQHVVCRLNIDRCEESRSVPWHSILPKSATVVSSRDGTITNSGRVQGLGLTTTDIII